MKNSKSVKIIFFSFLLSIAFSFPSYALEVKKQTLSNGLKVLHSERHNLPVVVLTLLIEASPFDEAEDKAGMAYLTARMLTEGTTKRKAMEIGGEIEFIGASLGAGANRDYTTVSLSVLKKDIEKGFEIFSDVLLNPSFPEDELKRQKEQIKGALKQQEEEPGFVASRTFIREVFGEHPYGRLTQGSSESIDRISRDDLTAFYRRHYLPGNAVLTIAGDLSAAELGSLTDRYLGGWKAEQKSADKDRKTKAVEGTKAPKVVVINKDITQANIIFGHLGISRGDPDYYAVSVMNYILGSGGFASRLMKVVRDDMGLAYSIHSSFAGNRYPGQFEVDVQTKNESAGTVITEIIKQINRIRTTPVSDQELADAKSYLTGSFPRKLETTSKIVEFISAVQFYNLGDDYIEKYPHYINSVTKEDVLRVAAKYLDPANYVLVVVGRKDLLNLPAQVR